LRCFAVVTGVMAACLGLQSRALAGNGPDLIVETFERTGQVQHKNGHVEIPVRFVVRNIGNQPTSVKIVNTIRVGSTERYSGFMDTLGSGVSRSVNTVVKIPDAGKLLAGRSLTLGAYADAPLTAADTSLPKHARVLETNENNNGKQLNVDVPGGFGLKAEAAAPARGPGAYRPGGKTAVVSPAITPKRIGNVRK
jgi:hypothetical protein